VKGQVSPESTHELENICKKIRLQQIGVIVPTVISSSVYFLIAARVLYAQYIIVLIVMGIDPLVLCYFLFTNYFQRSRKQNKQTGDTTSNDPNASNAAKLGNYAPGNSNGGSQSSSKGQKAVIVVASDNFDLSTNRATSANGGNEVGRTTEKTSTFSPSGEF
jgi:hypothetical protein